VSNIDSIEGEITFDPPISWVEIRDLGVRFVKGSGDKEYDRLLWLEVEEEEAEVDDGTLLRKRGVRFRISEYDALNAGCLYEEVENILKTFTLGAKGVRTFKGEILVLGERQGDIWRVRIVDNKAVEERVSITWPDGTRY
jgi:hypothetical protein